MECWQIKVTGKVQGVFYRASAQKQATELGIVGWVRNEQDTSVLIRAQGEIRQLEKFLAWCFEGPPQASVSGVKWEKLPLDDYTDFRVDHI